MDLGNGPYEGPRTPSEFDAMRSAPPLEVEPWGIFHPGAMEEASRAAINQYDIAHRSNNFVSEIEAGNKEVTGTNAKGQPVVLRPEPDGSGNPTFVDFDDPNKGLMWRWSNPEHVLGRILETGFRADLPEHQALIDRILQGQ